MSALLKDVYSNVYINRIADKVAEFDPNFDSCAFIKAVLNEHWPSMELKQRTLHIAQQLHNFLSEDYAQALSVIVQISPYFTGYEGMFTATFVEKYGLDEFQLSIDALTIITEYASAEFAVRPFIKKYPEQMHRVLLRWCESTNEHHRRLASEGCRPRLPWATALPDFKKDPGYILPILNALKLDESEYVRRSVANNLNDISKDHPKQVINIAQSWLKESHNQNTTRLVKHACRTLLKQANAEVLKLFGFLPPDKIKVTELTVDEQVNMGEELHFSCSIQHKQKHALEKLRIEFAIDFMKNNGQQARKIFQISESTINDSIKLINKSFSFKKISTRRYYPGHHGLAIIVNGVELASASFTLLGPSA